MTTDQMELDAPIVRVDRLTRRFGEKIALDEVNISLRRGMVLGLVGENGAGKTTLIKHILGLLKPTAGTVRVFGLDPTSNPVGVLGRIGYLAEEDGLPGWMRIDEIQRYARAFYPNWNQSYAEQLRTEFGLDPHARLNHLSKGQRARAGLMLALSYRPDLLLLDEPSSGLDPIVRRDILGAIIRTIAEEGRCVLFSSHLLGEVERVADNVAMIRRGRVVFSGELDTVKESHFMATLRFDEPRSKPPSVEGAFAWSGSGREWSALFCGSVAALEATAAVLGGFLVEHHGPTLDEIFVARSGASIGGEG